VPGRFYGRHAAFNPMAVTKPNKNNSDRREALMIREFFFVLLVLGFTFAVALGHGPRLDVHTIEASASR
jgi:hypothetical protein